MRSSTVEKPPARTGLPGNLRKSLAKGCLIVSVPFFALSCEDEEKLELEAIHAEQETLREEYDNRVKNLHKDLKTKQIEDPSDEIEALTTQIDASDQQITRLEEDIKGLQKETMAEKEKLASYQAKYRLSTQ